MLMKGREHELAMLASNCLKPFHAEKFDTLSAAYQRSGRDTSEG